MVQATAQSGRPRRGWVARGPRGASPRTARPAGRERAGLGRVAAGQFLGAAFFFPPLGYSSARRAAAFLAAEDFG